MFCSNFCFPNSFDSAVFSLSFFHLLDVLLKQLYMHQFIYLFLRRNLELKKFTTVVKSFKKFITLSSAHKSQEFSIFFTSFFVAITLMSVEKRMTWRNCFQHIFTTRKKLTGSEVRDGLDAFSFVIWIRNYLHLFS